MTRDAAQVLHHMFVNSAMRTYYASGRDGGAGEGTEGGRYMAGGERDESGGQRLSLPSSQNLIV